MTNAFDSFCSSFIESSRKQVSDGGVVFYSICGSVLALYLAFCVVFLVVMRFYLKQIETIVKNIFLNLPKEESGRVFHSLDLKTNQHSHKENSSIFTSYFIFMLLTCSIIAIILIASVLIIIEFESNVSTSSSTMETVSLLNTVIRTSMRVNFRLNELVLKSKLMKMSWETVKQDNMNELRKCDKAWREISAGGEDTGYQSPIAGVSPKIDLLMKFTCNTSTFSTNSTQLSNLTLSLEEVDLSIQCKGMDHLVSEFISCAIELNNDYYSNYYDQQRATDIYFKDIYFLSLSFAEKSFDFISTYVSFAKNSSISLSIAMFSISSVFCLMLLFWSYSNLSKYWNEKHNVRLMLNYISWEVMDQNEDLKQYAMTHQIPNKYPRSIQKLSDRWSLSKLTSTIEDDPLSMTKSIMNAAADGCIICTTEGTIIVFNKAAENMFGYQQSELLGASLISLFSEEEKQKIEKSVFSITASRNAFHETTEMMPIRKNKTSFSASVSISVSFFNKKSFIACFVKDITTERKQAALISEEKKKSEELLLNILPLPVAIRLKQGETSICEV